MLAIGVIASATFILISVDAFHKDAPSATDRQSGVGGYPLLVNLLLPIANDPNSRDGRERIGLGDAGQDPIAIEPFRVLPGDDASCLNLYEPRNPRILGAQPVVHRRGPVRVPELARGDRRRARQSLAAAEPRPRRGEATNRSP